MLLDIEASDEDETSEDNSPVFSWKDSL